MPRRLGTGRWIAPWARAAAAAASRGRRWIASLTLAVGIAASLGLAAAARGPEPADAPAPAAKRVESPRGGPVPDRVVGAAERAARRRRAERREAQRRARERQARERRVRERRARRGARRARRAKAARGEQRLRSAPWPRTVRGSVLRARRLGRIERSERDAFLRRYELARAAVRRLGGARRAELASVLRTLERIAARRRLTAGRMPVLFLQLERNRRFWARRGPPEPGTRLSFSRDPVVFQYYPGRGLQFQPLANFAKANRLYNACRGYKTRPGTPCREGALRRLLDRLVELGARRGSFLAWEYYFPFGGGSPPWLSGMSQGTAVQALARGSRLLGEPAYLRAASEALGAFETAPPAGVAVPARGGRHYLMYSFDRGTRILNGFLQAVSGIQTYARVSHERRAWRLFRAGERAARRSVPDYDTRAWSLYSIPGGESTLPYHRLVRDFLGNLCRRTDVPRYCTYEERFTGYLHEPPGLHVHPIRGARPGRPVRIRFDVGRSALVVVRVRGERRTVYRRVMRLGRGRHEVRWTPRGAHDYKVTISARGRRHQRAVRERLARVRERE